MKAKASSQYYSATKPHIYLIGDCSFFVQDNFQMFKTDFFWERQTFRELHRGSKVDNAVSTYSCGPANQMSTFAF